MSYSHIFFAVDKEELNSIVGSNRMDLYSQIESGEDAPEEGELDAVKRILAGNCDCEEGEEYLYGYALIAICDIIGERVGEGEVMAVRDHPYKSKLIKSTCPIEIPNDPSDFPEIHYLAIEDIEAEYRLVTETKPKAKRTLAGFFMRKLTRGMFGREPDSEEIAEDMEAYASALKGCLVRNRSLVSFRH